LSYYLQCGRIPPYLLSNRSKHLLLLLLVFSSSSFVYRQIAGHGRTVGLCVRHCRRGMAQKLFADDVAKLMRQCEDVSYLG